MQNGIIPSNQIDKLQTDKKLIAFYDKLKQAPVERYAQLHAKNEEENGRRQMSLIGIEIQDYSAGTGQNNIKARFNLKPEEIQFLLSRVTAGFSDFEFNSDKIYGNPDANGYAIAQKIAITRHSFDKNGNAMRRPWWFYIDNGKGIKVQNQNGGSYMKSGSYISEKSAFITLSDMEIFSMLKRVDSYITTWEMVTAFQILQQGRQRYADQVQSYINLNGQQNASEYGQNSQYQQQDYQYQQGYQNPQQNYQYRQQDYQYPQQDYQQNYQYPQNFANT